MELNDPLIECIDHRYLFTGYVGTVNYKNEFTVVVCNTADEVLDLVKNLESTSIEVWSCHDESDSDEISIPFEISSTVC